MKVSLKWLSDYVDIDCSTEELTEKLIMAGIEVESIDRICQMVSGVITGRIESVYAHPNADKLKLCDVTDGKEIFTVVCGAPNCRAGLVTAFAKAGAGLPAGKVKAAKIRGVKSAGMLVSKKEMGISEDHSGIFEAPEDTPLGKDLLDVLDLRDTILDVSITPNRPDWLSIIGIAREVAAVLGKSLKKPQVDFEPKGGQIDSESSVQIDDPDLCPRYMGILVKGIKIGPSPLWITQRLEAVGVRPINNIVDITNFVLYEIGQPLHAFDFDFLEEHRIVVRRCTTDEKITTLDDKERTLSKDSLLICDGKKPVALAGIMGGLNSLVTDQTTDVFIESAYFNPPNIRKTSKELGLSSESSYRFERGVDIEGVKFGLHRAARLMEQLGEGQVVTGHIDNYPGEKEAETVELRPQRVNKLLGTNLDTSTMKELLESIELPVEENGERLTVQVPSFRVDLEREVDLIEEVARLYGYDNIEPTIPSGKGTYPRLSSERTTELAVRDILSSAGMFETINFSFTGEEKLNIFHERPGSYVKLKNALSEDYSTLRDTLLPGLCQNLVNNLNRQARQVRLFEVRRVYFPKVAVDQLPDEPLYVSGVLAGRRGPEGWAQQNESVDFFDLKGLCEELFMKLGIGMNISWKKGDIHFLDPKCSAEVFFRSVGIGSAGKLSKTICDTYGISTDAFVFEFDLSKVQNDVLPVSSLKPISRFPITTRDVAIVVGAEIKAEQIRETIARVAPELIREVICFDVYTGNKISNSEKGLGFSIRMQKQDSEVPEAEAEQIMSKVLSILISRFDAKLRE